jgi:hypothetical protein
LFAYSFPGRVHSGDKAIRKRHAGRLCCRPFSNLHCRREYAVRAPPRVRAYPPGPAKRVSVPARRSFRRGWRGGRLRIGW